MNHRQHKTIVAVGVVWTVALSLACAAQYFSMTAFAGSGALPPRVGVPLFACTALAVVTSTSVALLRRRRNAKVLALAARITAIAVSAPSAVIVALGLTVADETSGVVLPVLFLGAGAISSWALASALTVSASAPPRLGGPAGFAIGLLPLLLVWLRVAT